MSVQKFRVRKNEGNFTTFPNKLLQNFHNMEALGLYCFLHSLPSGWEFHKTHLRKHTNLGINKLNKLLKTLEEHALIDIVQIRDAQGRFAHFDLQVNDGTSFVFNDLDETCAPLNENRDTENRATENSTYKRNNIENKDNIKKLNSASEDAQEKSTCSFDEFWSVYPVKKNKARAIRIWKRDKLHERVTELISDVSMRLGNCAQWKQEKFIPHPSTYLHNKLWNDDYTKDSAPNNKSSNGDSLSRVVSQYMNNNKGATYDQYSNTIAFSG